MKKIISIALLASLIMSFAACGGDGNNVTDSSDTADTVDIATKDEYTAPDVNYGGETFTVAGVDLTFAYSIAEYNIISHDEVSGDIINNAIINMTRKVEEELGVTLEFLDLGGDNARDNVELLTRYVYADEDIIQAALPISVGLANLLGSPELLTDLYAIETLELDKPWWDEKSVEEYTFSDRLYAANGDICLYRNGAPIVLFFNKELAEKHNLDDPYELVRNGEWTIDKMIEMAKTAAVDNGDQTVGLEDTFGFIGEQPTLPALLQSGGVDWSKRDGDGNVEITLYSERAAGIVEKTVPFIRDKRTSMYRNDWTSYGVDGVSGVLSTRFIQNGALFFSNQLLMALDFRAMDADFGVLPMPKYDAEQEGYVTAVNEWWCDNLVVPASNRNLEMTGHVLNAMGYYSSELITPAIIDTSVYGKSLRDDDSAEMINIIYDSMYYDVALLFDWGDITKTLYNMVHGSNVNLSSEYAKIESQIASEMEKTMEVLAVEQ